MENGENFISKYRTALMGFSILWVMLFHLSPNIPIVKYFFAMGYWGVDTFVFLSAYGLYFSFQRKGYSIGQFYKRRIIRLLPAYYIAFICIFFIDHFLGESSNSFIAFFQEASMLGFFLPFLHWPFFLWYIPGILLLYFFFPLLYRKRRFLERPICFLGFCICVFVINILLTSLFYQYNWGKYGLLLIIPRFIIFLIGLIWASHESLFMNLFLNKRKSLFFILVSIFCLGGTLFLKNSIPYYIQRLGMLEIIPAVLALPGLLMIFILIYDYSPSFLKRIIEFMGLYSLELYLVHQDLYRYGIYLARLFNVNETFICLFMFVISFGFAFILKKMVSLFSTLKFIKLHA